MTNAEAYKEGWHNGRRWAEEDLANHDSVDAVAAELREWYARGLAGERRALALGVIRGYRDTVDRFEKGEISWETFESPPEAPTQVLPSS